MAGGGQKAKGRGHGWGRGCEGGAALPPSGRPRLEEARLLLHLRLLPRPAAAAAAAARGTINKQQLFPWGGGGVWRASGCKIGRVACPAHLRTHRRKGTPEQQSPPTRAWHQSVGRSVFLRRLKRFSRARASSVALLSVEGTGLFCSSRSESTRPSLLGAPAQARDVSCTLPHTCTLSMQVDREEYLPRG
jgi:hypothetical protein